MGDNPGKNGGEPRKKWGDEKNSFIYANTNKLYKLYKLYRRAGQALDALPALW
jgi:hypothetical protein